MIRLRFRSNSDSQQQHVNMFINNTAGLIAGVLFVFLAMAGAWYAAVGNFQAQAVAATDELEGTEDKGTEDTLAEPSKVKLGAKALGGSTASSAVATRKAFLGALLNALSQQGVKARVFPENGILRISAKSVVFPVGQAHLKPESLGGFDRVGTLLEKALACVKPSGAAVYKAPAAMAAFSGAACSQAPEVQFECADTFKNLSFNAIQLEGHADARPIASSLYKDNLALSSARAETLLRRLQSCQPGLLQMANAQGNPLLNVASHSTQQPAEKENPLADANRRVELRFLIEGE